MSVPAGAVRAEILSYLAHTEGALPIREIARRRQCQPSTVLRQIRKVEARRDDPLFDDALTGCAEAVSSQLGSDARIEKWIAMIAQPKSSVEDSEDAVNREARRILRRLCEKDAFLAVATDMEKAVVMRESVPGRHTRTAVVDRDIAHQFALKDWIACEKSGRIARYVISNVGRAALKRLLEDERKSRTAQSGFSESASPFKAQHQEFGERRVMARDGSGETRLRYNLAESPLTVLGRKRDRAGQPYLTAELIEAGERLREDFELAQMGPRVTQNWESFLTPRDGGSTGPAAIVGGAEGPAAARDRVHAALTELGPGLSDVAFRVCCFLEGLETAEKRLGWSARSGKIVLRIALQRLAAFYGIRAKSADAETETA